MTEYLADIADKLDTLRKRSLREQIDFGCIHEVANARGGKPVDQANAAVGEYLRLRRLHVTMGLSAISTGLDQISRGRNEEGLRVARHGLEYLWDRIGEAQS